MNKPHTKHRLPPPAISDPEWYRDAFAEDYLWLYAHRSDREAARQVRAVRKHIPFVKGQKILDVACGTGRHLKAFAKMGARITGVDLSEILLKAARRKMRAAGLRAVFYHLDMRRMTFRERFDGVTMWFTSFGYFPTIADDRLVLRGMADALEPGGWWLIDLANPACLEKNLVPRSHRLCRGPRGRTRVEEYRRITRGRVIKVIRIVDAAGERILEESVRLYGPERFGALVKEAGLAAVTVLGDYDGTALTADSPRQIWIGRKR